MTLPFRSLLFVPGDSRRKLEKALLSNADGLVLDLEDSVAPSKKVAAREMVSGFLGECSSTQKKILIRINPLGDPHALADLCAVVAGGPAAILLPKVDGPQDVQRLSDYLDVLEAREGRPSRSIGILPVVTETARAPFSLGQYPHAGLTRLLGLTWGAEDLSSALGAATSVDDSGRWSLTYGIVRSLTLLAAKACNVQAIETLHADFKDEVGLRQSCISARREGFTGRFAIHPDQIDTINEAFSPDASDIAFAERIVNAFASRPDAGVIGLDGKMFDRPHLARARLILEMNEAIRG